MMQELHNSLGSAKQGVLQQQEQSSSNHLVVSQESWFSIGFIFLDSC